MRIIETITCLISVFICDITLVHFLKTFASIFGLYNMYIENPFVNKVTRWVYNGTFLKLFKTIVIRALSDKALKLVF